MGQLIYNQIKSELRLETKRATVKVLGLSHGTNYKKNIPLLELIDQKKSTDDARFIAYVEMSVSIKEYLESMFPYLNLQYLDLQFTSNELTEECLRQHDIFVENTKMIEQVEMNTLEKIRNKC